MNLFISNTTTVEEASSYSERLAVLSDVAAGRTLLVPVKFAVIEIFRFARLLRHAVWYGPEDALHHGQMLRVVVRLKERESEIELEQNAADAPDVAGLRPAELENYLGRPVVSRRNDGRVMLPVECGRAEVDHSNARVLHYSFVSFLYFLNHRKFK